MTTGIKLTLDDISLLFTKHGDAQYGGEAVSQLAHALQCAQLAERAGETPETVVAAFLHDVGHMIVADPAKYTEMTALGVDDHHEHVPIPYLSAVFTDAVLAPIRLHVDAKRYLCATNPTYWEHLSPASKRSLEVQGGPFSDEAARAFAALAYAEEAVRLRRYDDCAKVPNAITPGIDRYFKLMEQVARG